MTRIVTWIWQRLHLRDFPWLLFSLYGLLFVFYSLSYQNRDWMPDLLPMIAFPLFGCMTGYLLSRTRWNSLWCALYALLISLVTASQQIGEIIPFQFDVSFYDWVTQLNWQFLLYQGRFTGWVNQALMNSSISDPGWSILILICELWLTCTWFVWIIRRYQNLWVSVLPMLVLLALNVHTSKLPSTYLLISISSILALAAIHTYQGMHKAWNFQQMDYPESLWQDWMVAVMLISALALTIAYYAPEVTTPEGWQRINDWYEEIQTVSEEIGPGDGTSGTQSDFSNYVGPGTIHILSGPDVSSVGEPLPQNDHLAMWIRVADPTPRHWRNAVYSVYTGTGWLEAELEEEPVASQVDPIEVKLGSKLLKQIINLSGDYNGQLFAAADPVQVNKDEVRLMAVVPDGSRVLRGNVTRYEVTSLVPNVSAENLRASQVEIPLDIREVYLQLPETLPERVFSLTQQIVEGKTIPLDQIVMIQKYLRDSVPYDLNTPKPPEGHDVVDYFLFEAPSGFCTYYASSMVVMLRTLGIPARVVTGYSSGHYIMEQGVFQVSGNSAHAWVEVYFPEFGWISFEPTPSEEVPFYARPVLVIEPSPALSPQKAVRQLFWLRTGGFGLSGVMLVILINLAVRFLKRRRLIARQAKHPLMRQYYQLRYHLQSYGYAVLPTQTPQEFLALALPRLAEYPRIRAALQCSTEGVEKVLYSPYGLPETEVRQLRTALRVCWREWIRMGWRKILHAVKRKYERRSLKS